MMNAMISKIILGFNSNIIYNSLTTLTVVACRKLDDQATPLSKEIRCTIPQSLEYADSGPTVLCGNEEKS